MKTLTLVRHAKSSWKHDVNDKDRPLNKRGCTDAELVSNAFKKKRLVPDCIFSSPANRAMSTCNIFSSNLNFDNEKIEIKNDLYDFDGNQVTHFLKGLDKSHHNVMIFGHNHAFTSICNIFGNSFIENLPTSGLVVIDFDVNSWSEINKGSTRFTIFPRDLK